MRYILCLTTTNNKEKAYQLASHIIRQRLAACVNIIPQISSVYHWKGEIVEDQEFLLLIKTKEENFESLKSKIKELHNYELPEIIAFEIKAGLTEYLDWIKSNTC